VASGPDQPFAIHDLSNPQRWRLGHRALVDWPVEHLVVDQTLVWDLPPGCATFKDLTWPVDQIAMDLGARLPTKAGPVPDRLTIWPVDDGRYGLDATFQGASGFKRAEIHQAQLTRDGIPHSFRQELNDGWTLRFGPLPAVDVASALAAFVY
jgi:hypothetical protein